MYADNIFNYNGSFICTYKLMDDDEDRNILYQIQLADALNINNKCELIVNETLLDNRINELYELVKGNPIIIQCMKDSSFHEQYNHIPIVVFKMLFSYDNFDIVHKIISNIIGNDDLTIR